MQSHGLERSRADLLLHRRRRQRTGAFDDPAQHSYLGVVHKSRDEWPASDQRLHVAIFVLGSWLGSW